MVGRSGRFDLPGRAFIETAQPHNPVFALASAQDYEAFYREEILFRKVNLYPPFWQPAHGAVYLGIRGGLPCRSQTLCPAVHPAGSGGICRPAHPDAGPAGDTLYRVAGKYRCHLILKCRNDRRMRELTRRVLEQFYAQAPAGVQAIPDLD